MMDHICNLRSTDQIREACSLDYCISIMSLTMSNTNICTHSVLDLNLNLAIEGWGIEHDILCKRNYVCITAATKRNLAQINDI